MQWGLRLATPLFVGMLVAGLSLATTWGFALVHRFEPAPADVPWHLHLLHHTPLGMTVLASLGLAVFGWVMSRFININKFSLHSVYRNRLIRAYLGACNPRRNPNEFTGFDPKDNLSLSNLEQKPLHIINMALNLVSGGNLAWQQRKAETFTASALHAGNVRLGYRRVADYAVNSYGQGLSLGSAVGISGAAASPNQGYHSSPVVALLMTLFNVRLGAWLGNPGPAGNVTARHPAPRSSALHVLREAFGLTDDSSPYIYLSDGGHFENLGLYEMVLRRCHYIVLSDAGCDPSGKLEDLGNAIRKIRVDLGIPITLHKFDIHPRSSDKADGRYCAVGWIDYSRVDGGNAKPGLIVYLKPTILGDEPKDIFNYKESNPEFPHQTTGDQWFNESQFESYRMLGLHQVETICSREWSTVRARDPGLNPLATFVRRAYVHAEVPLPPSFSERLYAFNLPPRPSLEPERIRRDVTPAPAASAEKDA
jgi:hypothetical protein